LANTNNEIKVGQMLVCCSKLCENFIFGKEYKLVNISYSGNSYDLIDEDGNWAGIGSSYFSTREHFDSLTELDFRRNDKEILKSCKEFDEFRTQQWEEFLKEENSK
jgi:hypothetical protein